MNRIAIGIGGTAALYYAPVGYQVFESHGEERRIQNQYQSELQAAAIAEKSAEIEGALANALVEQVKEHRVGLSTLEKNLSAARKQVDIMEGQRKTMVKEIGDALDGAEQARGKLAKLTAEAAKRRQNAKVAEQALAAAHVHSKDIDALLNPLRHPFVKSLFE